jgi:hypothetical protein
MTSQFIFVRIRAAHDIPGRQAAPREEWLIAEWRDGAKQPLDYWISNLPIDAPPERLARLARLRWKVELDYRQLKANSDVTTTKGAPGWAGITTPRSSPPRTASTHWSGCAQITHPRPA